MATDGSIRITISAGLDRDVSTSFGNFEKMAERTARTVNKSMGGTAGGGFKTAAKEADKAAKEVASSWKKELAELNKTAKAQDRIWEKQARDRARLTEKTERDQERALQQETRNAERAANQRLRIEERSARKADAERQRFASRTSHRAVRFLVPNPIGAFGMAQRVGSDILRGAGVDFNVGSSVSRVVGLSSRITELQNQASINNQQVSHADLEGSIKGAADKYGFSRGDTAEALGKFADKTGDMKLGMEVIGKMAERAAASGGNIDDMMDAAGDVAMNLGPVKDKTKALTGVMDQMTIQGAKGAIEIKNLAQGGMSRIAANAGRYEGDADTNMKKLGALAQLARQSGGASSPAEAATAVARLTDQFATPARVKQFNARGIDVYSKTEKGQIRDVFSLIHDALLKTNGDALALKKMFASSVGAKPVMALSKEFNAAGGGEKGAEAVDKMLAGFMESADIQAKLDAANKQRDSETATKAQKFQSSLDDLTEKMSNELLPTLDQLKEPALNVAGALSQVAVWAAKNPYEAVGAAITAAIARAGIESAFRAGIEKMITNSAASGGISILAPAAITVASAVVAITEANKLAKIVGSKENAGDVLPGVSKGQFSIDQLLSDIVDPIGAIKRKSKVVADIGAHTVMTAEERMARPLTPEEYAQQNPRMALSFRMDQYNPQQRSAELQPPPPPGLDPAEIGRAVANALRGAELSVSVSNMPTDGPVVKPGGRDDPPGPHRWYEKYK